ncbi:hypothetical protein FSARC_2361 [Fusarium sarcochroum]|uniref:Trichothecene 3-O-acetyltransferase-like N-terminal domain-containing protein n=1 Tax=Fusarium sarcochroum TaxID=1208366 RepID=A0A8H4U6E4_9HYPO|nr:hypothetical protein FSARC_2361 [Fusarium sarcochroum]
MPLESVPRLFMKDLRNDPTVPSLDELRRSGFPMRCFDEDTIAPRKSNSGTPSEALAEVFQVQANIIQGGLILTFLGQHQAMDGVGQNQIMNLLSKACKGEAFSHEELAIGNQARESIIPLLGPSWEPGPELAHNIVKHDLQQPGPGSSEVKMPHDKGTWRHFEFSHTALTMLKSRATSTLPATATYISTDDTITAFVWQAIIRARISRSSLTTEAKVARAVDLRRYLDVPSTYPGFVQSMTYHNLTMHEAANSPLGAIAAMFRTELDAKSSDLEYYGRSLATLIDRTPDKTRVSLLAGFDMAKDVMVNSWANQNSYELDFGLDLGAPEAVRRPRFDGFQGLVYLMPRKKMAGVGVAICLSADDMDRLTKDEDFCSFATYVG